MSWLKWKWFNFRCNRGWGGRCTYKGRVYMQSKMIKFPPPDYSSVIGIDFGFPDKHTQVSDLPTEDSKPSAGHSKAPSDPKRKANT